MASVYRPPVDLTVLGAVLRAFRTKAGYTREQLSFLDVSWEEFGTAVNRRSRRRASSEH